jgi:hypothetical protein
MDTKILNTFLIGERSVGAEHTPDGGAHGRILAEVDGAQEP